MSKIQNTAFLFVDIQIWIDFYLLTWPEKDTLKLGASLVYLDIIKHKPKDIIHSKVFQRVKIEQIKSFYILDCKLLN